MTRAHVNGEFLDLRFTTLEKISGLVTDQRIPLSAVRGAEVVPDGLGAARGLRAPGLALPGRRKIGTWRRRGTTSLVAVRRGRPALRVTLAGARYDELLLDVPDAGALAARLAPRTPAGSP